MTKDIDGTSPKRWKVSCILHSRETLVKMITLITEMWQEERSELDRWHPMLTYNLRPNSLSNCQTERNSL